MAITYGRTGQRLVHPWSFDLVARPRDRLVGESAMRRIRVPAVYVEEKGDEPVLTADLPAFAEESIEVGLEKSVLTLRGPIAGQTGTEDRRRPLRERCLWRVQRSSDLPGTVTADAVTATFENGVLHLHMPKTPESKGRTIPIRRESQGAPRDASRLSDRAPGEGHAALRTRDLPPGTIPSA